MGVSRRRVLTIASAAAGVLVLTACSGFGTSVGASGLETGGESVGSSALTSTASPSPSSGWVSSTPCTPSLESGLKADLPAGATVTALNPATTNGLVLDSTLTTGYVASCAFYLTSGGRDLNELYFFGMDPAHAADIEARLSQAGFVAASPAPITSGTQVRFTGSAGAVLFDTLATDEGTVYLLAG